MINQHLFHTARTLARELATWLGRRKKSIVFAESCTAGLSSAILAQVPGISKWLCGSVVTYQESAKQEWLKIDAGLIREHTAVSPGVTEQMAQSVLQITPAADFSVAITGHLQREATTVGPHCLVALGYRDSDRICLTRAVRYQLACRTRIDRQWEAARAALNLALEHLHFPPSTDPKSVNWTRICGKPTNFNWNHWI